MALIDIVIPNYQYGKYLRRCVESVVTQGVDDIRILIIDNASTDDSVEVAEDLRSRDPRIQVKTRSINLGTHASFNEGVDWAESDYFLLLCSDDLIAPGSLERALKILDDNIDISFVYGEEYTWDSSESLPNLTTQKDHAPHTLVEGQQFIESLSMPQKAVGTGSIVARTSLQKRVGHFRSELNYTCDIEVLMRLACLGQVAKVDAIQGCRFRHGENISVNYWGDWKRELEYLLDAYESFFRHEGASLPDAVRLQQHVRRNIAHRAYWAGVSHRLRGLKPESAALFAFARSTYPPVRLMPPVSYWFRVENAPKIFAEKARELVLSRFRSGTTSLQAVNGGGTLRASWQARKRP
jgi:glycosyltransferase involved in cell wall biosynthesis